MAMNQYLCLCKLSCREGILAISSTVGLGLASGLVLFSLELILSSHPRKSYVSAEAPFSSNIYQIIQDIVTWLLLLVVHDSDADSSNLLHLYYIGLNFKIVK